jgi:hypothetical protein
LAARGRAAYLDPPSEFIDVFIDVFDAEFDDVFDARRQAGVVDVDDGKAPLGQNDGSNDRGITVEPPWSHRGTTGSGPVPDDHRPAPGQLQVRVHDAGFDAIASAPPDRHRRHRHPGAGRALAGTGSAT